MTLCSNRIPYVIFHDILLVRCRRCHRSLSLVAASCWCVQRFVRGECYPSTTSSLLELESATVCRLGDRGLRATHRGMCYRISHCLVQNIAVMIVDVAPLVMLYFSLATPDCMHLSNNAYFHLQRGSTKGSRELAHSSRFAAAL